MIWRTTGFSFILAALMARGALGQSVADMIAAVPQCAVSVLIHLSAPKLTNTNS